jgi:signal transduction histidine kinase/predicted CoA-binding protein
VYHFLKKVPLFANLAPADLEQLCELVTELHLTAGEELFQEGAQGDRAYVIKEGQLEILKSSGGSTLLLAVRQPGDVIGEMALLESAPRFATVRARSDAHLLVIEHQHLDLLLSNSPSAARTLLHTITARLRASEQALLQNEKLAQLGTMSAGIAHELNNPAAAVGRGAKQLAEAFNRLQLAYLDLHQSALSEAQTGVLKSFEQMARQRAAHPLALSLLERSDLEQQLEDWLEQHGIPGGWELAPLLVGAGIQIEQLDDLAREFSASAGARQTHRRALGDAARYLEATFSVYALLAEITQGAGRMSDIIKALKSYVYLDQAPVQMVDINEALENTLIILSSKLKEGITVHRHYDPDLPRINAYGSELNQVWTNIIDNAIDAMDGRGEITLRTYQMNDWVMVEIEDNGPGIPSDIQSKIFSPFFTTKAVGKGTGLGLNITYNIVKKHSGEITVTSLPGNTCFEVRLPVDFEHVKPDSMPLAITAKLNDEQLLKILNEAHTIAVVGISDNSAVPAYTVPAYLQQAGYRIIPVNPKLEEVLGEPAYPDLLSLSEPVDVVLVFRRSDQVPGIVEQAIRNRAKVVWMQQGISNDQAAALAQREGLQVVMDTCMRTTHKRLVSMSA